MDVARPVMGPPARPGIHEAWAKAWKTVVRNSDEWFESHSASEARQLAHYLEHGTRMPPPKGEWMKDERADPPWRPWESADILGNVVIYCALHAWKWERAAVAERRLDDAAAATMFEAHETATVMELENSVLVRKRFPDRAQRSIFAPRFTFTALGAFAFDAQRALAVARLQLEALARDLFSRSYGAESAFIVRAFADYLGLPDPGVTGDPEHLQKGEIALDPIYQALLAHWREPVADRVAPYCVAALDAHTWLAYRGRDMYRREFASYFTRTPLAVLLVFKLRELEGLANPALDHPLMEGAMASLPRVAQPQPADALLADVRSRMAREGFDEQVVRAAFQPDASTQALVDHAAAYRPGGA